MSKSKYTREYLGVTITQANYKEVLDVEGRDGINFSTKHLRAYLKGKKTFVHGYRTDKDGRRYPLSHIVQEKINLVE